MRGGQAFDQREKLVRLFALEQQCAGIGFVGAGQIARGLVGIRDEDGFVAARAAPVLHAFLVRDAEEPRPKLAVVAQAREVADGCGKRLLHDVERGGVVAEKFGGVGVKRQLVPLEQGVPGIRRMLAGGVEEIGFGGGHEGALESGMAKTRKGSIALQARGPVAELETMTTRLAGFRFFPRGALAVFAFAAATFAGRAAIKVGAWTPIFQGVEMATGEADAAEPRLQQVRAVRIDLRAPGIELFSTPANGDASLETTSETTSEFLAHYHLQVAINANFYAPCCTPGDKDLVGLAISRGGVVSPPATRGTGSKVLAITRDNHAVIAPTEAGFPVDKYWTAVAGSEIVLIDGKRPPLAPTEFNQTAHPRTAVGVSRDGRYLILLVIDGRQPGYSVGAPMEDVAAWLLRFGASDGLNLDGGGSTAPVREQDGRAVTLNQPSGVALGSSDNAGKSGSERQQRSNGNNLGVFAKPLPAAK